MKYYIKTYGCQMNMSDSERIASILEAAGYEKASSSENADALVFNLCSVRQSAINRIYGQFKGIIRRKKNNPHFKLIITGCILETDKLKMQKYADEILDVRDMETLPALLGMSISDKLKREDYLDKKPIYENNFRVYVPIMTGCNNFCSYCVVPYTRGREYSRSVLGVLKEIDQLLKKGFKEIILVGQNVNSYQGRENGKLVDFPKLLAKVHNLPGDFWLSYITSHPKDMSDELIEISARLAKVLPYIHLPFQSGDDKILKNMNRNYTAWHYLELVKKIRAAFAKHRKGLEQKVALSTDIIVGFPGETRAQFENTLKLMQEVGFSMAYIAEYSPRPNTHAFKMSDNVGAVEKKRRWLELTEELGGSALKINKEFLEKTVEVIVEKCKKKEDGLWYFGKDRRYATVKFKADLFSFTEPASYALPQTEKSAGTKQPIKYKDLIGKIIKIKIKKADNFGLSGEIV